MVSVDNDKCIGCGVCESVCPRGVFTVVDGKVSVRSEDCIGCGNCESVCPAGCITLGKQIKAIE